MIPEIHAVKAVYEASTFDPKVAIQTSQPISYKCYACSFEGSLEQSVEHIVHNQFRVEDPKPRPVMIKKKEHKRGRR